MLQAYGDHSIGWINVGDGRAIVASRLKPNGRSCQLLFQHWHARVWKCLRAAWLFDGWCHTQLSACSVAACRCNAKTPIINSPKLNYVNSRILHKRRWRSDHGDHSIYWINHPVLSRILLVFDIIYHCLHNANFLLSVASDLDYMILMPISQWVNQSICTCIRAKCQQKRREVVQW